MEDISTVIPSLEYSEALTEWPATGLPESGFSEIEEYASEGVYAIAFDVRKAQHLQLKEK
jgi:hypothetical protein